MKLANFLNLFLLVALLSFTLLSFTSCSSSNNIGDIVCDYGTSLCEVSTALCNDIPGVPPKVCDYLDLACYNLTTICELRDSDPEEEPRLAKALENLQLATEKLQEFKLSLDSVKVKLE